MDAVPACLCTVYVPDVHGCQGKASDALELELHVVMNHHINTGN